MGQSMGGAGTWNLIASRPRFFAAAVTCCGSISLDDGTGSVETPLWNFHGASDQTVPVPFRASASRRDGKRVDIRSPPSTPAWTTTFGSGLSPNRSFPSGCSPTTWLTCRIIVQILSQPPLDFGHTHSLALVIVIHLIAVDFAETEITGLRMGKV